MIEYYIPASIRPFKTNGTDKRAQLAIKGIRFTVTPLLHSFGAPTGDGTARSTRLAIVSPNNLESSYFSGPGSLMLSCFCSKRKKECKPEREVTQSPTALEECETRDLDAVSPPLFVEVPIAGRPNAETSLQYSVDCLSTDNCDFHVSPDTTETLFPPSPNPDVSFSSLLSSAPCDSLLSMEIHQGSVSPTREYPGETGPLPGSEKTIRHNRDNSCVGETLLDEVPTGENLADNIESDLSEQADSVSHPEPILEQNPPSTSAVTCSSTDRIGHGVGAPILESDSVPDLVHAEEADEFTLARETVPDVNSEKVQPSMDNLLFSGHTRQAALYSLASIGEDSHAISKMQELVSRSAGESEEFPENDSGYLDVYDGTGIGALETNPREEERHAKIGAKPGSTTSVKRAAGEDKENEPSEVDSDELSYIDEKGLNPYDQYNSGSSVSFFNPAASTMGYTTARLLQFRLNGIVSLPGANKANIDLRPAMGRRDPYNKNERVKFP